MRHLKVGKKLGRTASHRKATLRALSASLIKHHRIITTLAKAKELRRFVEPVVTKSKEDTSHHRQQVFAFLQDKEAVTHLFEEVGALVADRQGGYTRIIKLAPRKGDGAEMAMIELVDYNDVKPEGGKTKRKRTRRGGSGRSKKKSTQKPAEQKKKEKSEEVPAEAETEEKTEKKTKAEKPAPKKKEAEATAQTKDETTSEVKADTSSKAKAEEAGESEPEAKSEAKEEKSKAGDKKEDKDEKDSSDKK